MSSATTWLGRLLALCTLGWASGLFYFGWIFVLHDYPRGGNPLGALALLAACSRPEPPQEPVRSVKLMTVGLGALQSQLEYAGE
eukprot:gene47291-63378_t